MSFALIVEPEAEGEIDEAARWYDANSPGLGEEFLHSVAATLATIQENPFLYQTVHGQMRRAGLRTFPYGLIYIASGQDVIVMACVHGRRDPKSWQDRS